MKDADLGDDTRDMPKRDVRASAASRRSRSSLMAAEALGTPMEAARREEVGADPRPLHWLVNARGCDEGVCDGRYCDAAVAQLSGVEACDGGAASPPPKDTRRAVGGWRSCVGDRIASSVVDAFDAGHDTVWTAEWSPWCDRSRACTRDCAAAATLVAAAALRNDSSAVAAADCATDSTDANEARIRRTAAGEPPAARVSSSSRMRRKIRASAAAHSSMATRRADSSA